MKCPACHKKASVEHYRESPHCIPAVRSLNGMANVSMRKKLGKVGRPKKQTSVEYETIQCDNVLEVASC